MRYIYTIAISIFFLIFNSLNQKIHAQCQNINAHIISSPMYDITDSVLRICQNTSVVFTGHATFETTSVGATYDWKINNEPGFATTTTFTHLFTEGGVYVIDFVPLDSAGCTSTDCQTRIVVHVSPTPSFAGTSVPDSICQGVPFSLSAGGYGSGEITTVITPDTPSFECAPPISETTFLPDRPAGVITSYSTSINVECFTPCDTLEDGDQILGICLNMEHSYLGDLDWKIICPDGREAMIKQNPGGGGTYLGAALDDGSLLPGEGFEYCFSDLSERNDMLTALGAGGSTVTAGTPPSASMAPGFYKPFESFDNLIGCPLNGEWTIVVTDYLTIDNGYIFGWHIDFDFSEVEEYRFNTEIVDFNWSGPAEVIPGTPYSIIPEDTGVLCYTLLVTDNFGCEYDTTLCTYSKSFPDPGLDSSATVCPSFGTINLMEYLGGEPELGGFWTGPSVSATGLLNTAAVVPGTHEYVYTVNNTFCDTTATVTLTIENSFDFDFDFHYSLGCENDTVHFQAISDDVITYYRWNYGDATPHDTMIANPTHVYEEQGEYGVWFIAVNEAGCIDSIQKIVNTSHPFDAAFTQSSDSICQHDANTVYFYDNSIGNISNWSWDFGDGNTSDLQHPSHTFTEAGTFNIRLIVTENIGCVDTFYSTVYVDPTPSIKIKFNKDEICSGESIDISATTSETVQNLIWNFGDGTIINSLDLNYQHSYPYPGQYYVSVTSEHPVCPNVSAMDTVFSKPYPTINLGIDQALCLKGAPIEINPVLTSNNPPNTIYYWSNGDTSNVYKITEPGNYRVYANLNGCITTDEFEVKKDCYTDIPNSFTPDNDGNNDYFFPRQYLSDGIVSFKMSIFNRWGELVFETENPNGRGWDGKFDGKDQPMGVYIYQINLIYKNQVTEKYSGNVTLIR